MSIDPHWVFENYKEAAQLIESLQRERDVLDAHVERLRETLQWVWDKVNLGGWAHERVKTALEDTPETSLARMKAQCQAEVLDRLMPAICDWADRAEVRSLRDELRRQAEGSEP